MNRLQLTLLLLAGARPADAQFQCIPDDNVAYGYGGTYIERTERKCNFWGYCWREMYCNNCPNGRAVAPLSQRCRNDDCLKYVTTPRVNRCGICPAGTGARPRASSCTPCQPGSVQPYSGQPACNWCLAGTYAKQANLECQECPVGTVSADRATGCSPCGPGTYANQDHTACILCEAGTISAGGVSACTACPAGTFASGLACRKCPAGHISQPAANSCEACPAGTYANAEQTACLFCGPPHQDVTPRPACIDVNFQSEAADLPAGYLKDYGLKKQEQSGYTYGWNYKFDSDGRERGMSSNQVEDTLMILNRENSFWNAVWEIDLEPDTVYDVTFTFSDPEFASNWDDCMIDGRPLAGAQCPDGGVGIKGPCYVTYPKAKAAADAKLRLSGKYTGTLDERFGQTRCDSVAAVSICPRAGGPSYDLGGWDPNQEALSSQDQCACAPGWTGEFCDRATCPQVTPSVSLGVLVLQVGWPLPTRELDPNLAREAISAALRAADTSGDERLSADECRAALADGDMIVSPNITHVWAEANAQGNVVFKDDATISEMVQDTLELLARTGGTELWLQPADSGQITSAAATYPNKFFDEEACAADFERTPRFDWSLELNGYQVHRQCGFMNGVAITKEEGFDDDTSTGGGCATGGSCDFYFRFNGTDGPDVRGRKRSYCVEVQFCQPGVDCADPKNVDETLTAFRCSSGLWYDGVAADILPRVEDSDGVDIGFLDTSSDETGYRLYKYFPDEIGDSGNATELLDDLIGQYDMAVNPCGRRIHPAGFRDKIALKTPGAEIGYAVVPLAAGQVERLDKIGSTNIIVPWFSELRATVATQNGAPVEGVVCTVSRDLSPGKLDPRYRNFMTTTSDRFGVCSFSVRVADRTWNTPTQYLRVDVALDGHDFQEAYKDDVAIQNQDGVQVDFVDTTSRFIRGTVLHGGLEGGDYDGLCQHTAPAYMENTEACVCPVANAVLMMTVGDEDPKEVTIEADGSFETTAALNERVFLYVEPYIGAQLDGGRLHEWTMTYEGGAAQPLNVSASGVDPYIRYVVEAPITVHFTAVTTVPVVAHVVGGAEAHKFVTGQVVVASLERCAWSMGAYTTAGVADFGELGAAAGMTLAVVNEADDACEELGAAEIAAVKAGTRGCRVPMPAGPASDRSPCPAGAFAYVDEFFAGTPPEARDLSKLANETTTETFTFEFVTPLCLDAVGIADARGSFAQDACLGNLLPTPGCRDDEGFGLSPTENLLLDVPGVGQISGDGSVCVETDAVFRETDEIAFTFPLVEYYPVCAPGQVYPFDDCPPEKDAADPDVAIVAVEGDATTDYSPGFSTTLVVPEPRTFVPYALPYSVSFRRDRDQSLVPFDRYYIAVGAKADDVPAIYPTATVDPLIFIVLADPPGSDSTASIAKGSTVTTSMGVEGAHAATLSKGTEYGLSLGWETESRASIAVWGVGLSTGTWKFEQGNGLSKSRTGPSVSVSRGSSQAFDLELTFSVGVSTSDDPGLAGEPSDVIVGGGANLRMISAREVFAVAGDVGKVCVDDRVTSQFLPSQITTWVMSVYEIELTMTRLAAVSETNIDPDKKAEVEAEIDNWATVLRNYRATKRGPDLKSLENSIQLMLQGTEALYQQFLTDAEESDSYKDFLRGGLAELRNVKWYAARDSALGSFKAQGFGALDPTSVLGGNIITGGGKAWGAPKFVGANVISLFFKGLASAVFAAATEVVDQIDYVTGASYGTLQNYADILEREVNKASANCQVSPWAQSWGERNENGGRWYNAGNLFYGQAKPMSHNDPLHYAVTDDGGLCETYARLKEGAVLAGKLLGICDGGGRNLDLPEGGGEGVVKSDDAKARERAAQYGDPTRLGEFCAQATQEQEQGAVPQVPSSIFDAFSNTDHYITFAGGTETTFEYEIGRTQGYEQSFEYGTASEDAYGAGDALGAAFRRRLFASPILAESKVLAELPEDQRRRLETSAAKPKPADASGGFENPCDRRLLFAEEHREGLRRLGLGACLETGATNTGATEVSIGRSAGRGRGSSSSVSVALKDGDAGDYFAVKVQADPTHGAPVFTTMGGMSSCPGESATTKLDSGVAISDITMHCLSNSNCQGLLKGETALVSVVMFNQSPWADSVEWVLRVSDAPNAAWDGTQGGATFCEKAREPHRVKVEVVDTSLDLRTQGLDLELPQQGSSVLLKITRDELFEQQCGGDYTAVINLELVAACEDGETVYQYRTGTVYTYADTDEVFDAPRGDLAADPPKDVKVAIQHPQWDSATKSWREGTGAFESASVDASFTVSWGGGTPAQRSAGVARLDASRTEGGACCGLSCGVDADCAAGLFCCDYPGGNVCMDSISQSTQGPNCAPCSAGQEDNWANRPYALGKVFTCGPPVVVAGYVKISNLGCAEAMLATQSLCSVFELLAGTSAGAGQCAVTKCDSDQKGIEAGIALNYEMTTTAPDEAGVRAALEEAAQDPLRVAWSQAFNSIFERDDPIQTALLEAEVDEIVIYAATYSPTAAETYEPTPSAPGTRRENPL